MNFYRIMAKKVTLTQIMKELHVIKRLVLKDLQLDEEEMKIQKSIKRGSNKSRIFESLQEWQAYVWTGCKNKKQISRGKTVVFDCKVQKNKCTFGKCPLNIRR